LLRHDGEGHRFGSRRLGGRQNFLDGRAGGRFSRRFGGDWLYRRNRLGRLLVRQTLRRDNVLDGCAAAATSDHEQSQQRRHYSTSKIFPHVEFPLISSFVHAERGMLSKPI